MNKDTLKFIKSFAWPSFLFFLLGGKNKIVVKTWCESTKEAEEYLKCNGYRNAKRIGETDLYEVECIGLPLRDVAIWDGNTLKPLIETIRAASSRTAKAHSTDKSPLEESISHQHSSLSEIKKSYSELESKNSKGSQTEDLIKEVELLNNNTPDGIIIDADTILVDLIDRSDFEVSGFAQEIFDIWKNSTDKKAVELLFYSFTDMEFDKYLLKCKEEITRKPESISHVKEKEPDLEI